MDPVTNRFTAARNRLQDLVGSCDLRPKGFHVCDGNLILPRSQQKESVSNHNRKGIGPPREENSVFHGQKAGKSRLRRAISTVAEESQKAASWPPPSRWKATAW